VGFDEEQKQTLTMAAIMQKKKNVVP